MLAFYGDLGSGKSFFCRHIIKYLCGKHTNVASPTFNLLQIYDQETCSIYHYDFYRLKNIHEIYELGIEEALSGHIVLIEWPELVESILPIDTIHINIKTVDRDKRVVFIKNTNVS